MTIHMTVSHNSTSWNADYPFKGHLGMILLCLREKPRFIPWFGPSLTCLVTASTKLFFSRSQSLLSFLSLKIKKEKETTSQSQFTTVNHKKAAPKMFRKQRLRHLPFWRNRLISCLQMNLCSDLLQCFKSQCFINSLNSNARLWLDNGCCH